MSAEIVTSHEEARTQQTEVPDRGFLTMTPSVLNAEFALLQKMDLVDQLLSETGLQIPKGETPEQTERIKRYLVSSLDFWVQQGYLVYAVQSQTYFPTHRGREFLKKAASITQIVDQTYSQFVGVAEDILGWEHETAAEYALPQIPGKESDVNGRQAYIEGALIAGTSILHILKINGERIAKLLAEGQTVDFSEILESNEHSQSLQHFLNVLVEANLLTKEEGENLYRATTTQENTEGAGVPLMKNAGFAALIFSYFEMYQKLHELLIGEIEYQMKDSSQETGSTKERVYRHAHLNTEASTGLLSGGKVANESAQIVKNIFNEQKEQHGKANFVVIDNGTGGGEYAALLHEQTGLPIVGIDFNPKTVNVAKKNMALLGFSGEVKIEQGDITDPEQIRGIVKKLSSEYGMEIEAGYGCATINYIPHDIGPEMFKEFLETFRKVLTIPIVINESFCYDFGPAKRGDVDMPNFQVSSFSAYQPALFKDFHDKSGQQLMPLDTWIEVIKNAGYTVNKAEVTVHASAPDPNKPSHINEPKDSDNRFPTLATIVARPIAA